MVAFPIPGPDGVPPVIGVAFGIVATVAFVVIVLQAVRYFRNSGDRHDQFGPPIERHDSGRDDGGSVDKGRVDEGPDDKGPDDKRPDDKP